MSERKSKFEGKTDKVCSGCSKTLALGAFYQKRAEAVDGHRYKTAYGRAMQPCKECRIARSAELKEDPERKLQIRSWNLKKLYNVTLEEYDLMLDQQNGGCAICGSPQGEGRSGILHVDHCHTTGRIRGLLCGNCNKALGCMKDSSDLLRKGAEYLER